jgi:hypothetical protein
MRLESPIEAIKPKSRPLHRHRKAHPQISAHHCPKFRTYSNTCNRSKPDTVTHLAIGDAGTFAHHVTRFDTGTTPDQLRVQNPAQLGTCAKE